MMDSRDGGVSTDNAKLIVLVTGATGFIGASLTQQLRSRGYVVRVYSRQSFKEKNNCDVGKDHWFTGELNDLEALSLACAGVDTIFHLAGIAHSRSVDSQEIHAANVEGTKNLYCAANEGNVRKFVYMSSILASNPEKSIYANSKAEAERFLSSFDDTKACTKVVILRPANVYGVGMHGSINTFIKLARLGILPALPMLNKSIPLVSVLDLCNVAISVAEEGCSGSACCTFLVADSERYTPQKIEEIVYNSLKRKVPKWRLPRAAFYFAASLATLLNYLHIKKSSIDLNLYRNLVSLGNVGSPDTPPEYEYEPSTSLEREMPKIINQLKTD